MTESLQVFKAIEFGFVAAVIALFFVLAIAGLVIGFDFDNWPDWQAGIVSMVAAIFGVVAAAFGVRASSREHS